MLMILVYIDINTINSYPLIRKKIMKIKGIKRTFSTNNNNQYKTISSFWDEYCLKYQLEDLIGIGFNWTSSTIDYMIALKDKDIDEYNFELDIDKNVNWQTKSGQTKELDKLYMKYIKMDL